MKDSLLYLAKPTKEIVGCFNGLVKESVKLKEHLTDIWELTFDVERYTDENGKLVQTDYYETICDGMWIYKDGEDAGYFIIDAEPKITVDGEKENKTVTCHSCECEFQNKFLRNFKINTGNQETSLEYLATDNVDDYTGLPKEYISLVNYENNELSLFHLMLEKANASGWTVKENLPPEICSKYFTFDVDKQDIYSFMTQELASSAKILIDFDRKNMTVGFVSAEEIGSDTGIYVSYRNLLNNLTKNPVDDSGIITKYYPTGLNNLGILYANFGQDSIIDLDYYMNAKNEYGNLKFTDSATSKKWNDYVEYIDYEKVTFDKSEYTRRELFMELTKLYNKAYLDKNTIINRVPNDGCKIDYTTYKYEELITSLTAYRNALDALITIYKNEYDVISIGEAPDYTPTPETATNIKDTDFWYDFFAYKEEIIPKVMEALKIWCKTNSDGDLCDENGIKLVVINKDTLITFDNGLMTNPAYADGTLKDIDYYKYELSLYGIDELNAKRLAWVTAANTLFKDAFLVSGTQTENPVYRTANEEGWNSLSDDQKSSFTSLSSYIDSLNQFLDYMSFDTRQNGLTKKFEKGIVRLCDDKIAELTAEAETLDAKMADYQAKRIELQNSCTYDKYFSTDEKSKLNAFIKESEYSNGNILITNLDDIVTTVDAQNELYLDAKDNLFVKSHPQWKFEIEADNLYRLTEYDVVANDCKVGNFIRVQTNLCRDEFVKLRLAEIEFNPCEISQDLKLGFTNMTYTYNKRGDLDYIFGEMYKTAKGGSSSSSSSGSSSGGTYGDNDAEIQMSNNMLNALLKSDSFGTVVRDVVVDSFTANKANFQNMIAGTLMANTVTVGNTVISPDCLVTGQIKSSNYSSIEGLESGSMLDLDDGSFSFAGGNLTYNLNDGLSIKGNVSAYTGKIGDLYVTNNGLLYDTSLIDYNNLLYDLELKQYYYIRTGTYYTNTTVGGNTAIAHNYTQYIYKDESLNLCYIKKQKLEDYEEYNENVTISFDLLDFSECEKNTETPVIPKNLGIIDLPVYYGSTGKVIYYKGDVYYKCPEASSDYNIGNNISSFIYYWYRTSDGNKTLVDRVYQITGDSNEIYKELYDNYYIYSEFQRDKYCFQINNEGISFGKALFYDISNDTIEIDTSNFKLNADGVSIMSSGNNGNTTISGGVLYTNNAEIYGDIVFHSDIKAYLDDRNICVDVIKIRGILNSMSSDEGYYTLMDVGSFYGDHMNDWCGMIITAESERPSLRLYGELNYIDLSNDPTSSSGGKAVYYNPTTHELYYKS